MAARPLRTRLYVSGPKGATLPNGALVKAREVLELDRDLPWIAAAVDAGQLCDIYRADPRTVVAPPPVPDGLAARDCPACGQSSRIVPLGQAVTVWRYRRLWSHEANLRRAFLLAALGVPPQRAAESWARSGRYHATLTYAWCVLVAAYDGPWPPPPDHELWDRSLHFRHYSIARLGDGRQRLAAPDRAPLPQRTP